MRFLPAFIACAAFLLASGAHASVAKDAVRADIGGIDVVALHTSVQDVVTVVGSLPAGDDRSPPGNVMLATLTGAMLDKGTTTQDKFAIAQKLGNVGAVLSFAVDTNTLEIRGRCLRKDLPLLVGLMAEQLRTPAFSDQEFAKLKVQLQGAVRQQQEDTDFRAGDAFSRAVFRSGIPTASPPPSRCWPTWARRRSPRSGSSTSSTTGRPACGSSSWATWNQPRPKPRSARHFRDGPVARCHPPWRRRSRLPSGRDRDHLHGGQDERLVVIGQATRLRYSDPERCRCASARGSSAAAASPGRLMANVRDKEGLTYGIDAFMAGDTFVDGEWRIEANSLRPCSTRAWPRHDASSTPGTPTASRMRN